MANMPHPSRQAVTWRLRRDLVGAVRQAAAQRGETVLAFVTRALTREVERTTAGAVPDRVADVPTGGSQISDTGAVPEDASGG